MAERSPRSLLAVTESILFVYTQFQINFFYTVLSVQHYLRSNVLTQQLSFLLHFLNLFRILSEKFVFFPQMLEKISKSAKKEKELSRLG